MIFEQELKKECVLKKEGYPERICISLKRKLIRDVYWGAVLVSIFLGFE